MDKLGLISGGGRNFSLPHHVQTELGPTQPPIKWVPGALSLGVNWPGNEADRSPPSSTEDENVRSSISTPPCLDGMVLN